LWAYQMTRQLEGDMREREKPIVIKDYNSFMEFSLVTRPINPMAVPAPLQTEMRRKQLGLVLDDKNRPIPFSSLTFSETDPGRFRLREGTGRWVQFDDGRWSTLSGSSFDFRRSRLPWVWITLVAWLPLAGFIIFQARSPRAARRAIPLSAPDTA